MDYVEHLLSRNGRIGRRFIWGDFRQREQYARFKAWINGSNVKRRRELARQHKNQATVGISLDQGFAVVDDMPSKVVPEIVAQTKQIISQDSVYLKRTNNKAQLLTGLLKNDQLSLDSPFVKFALDEGLLSGIANYLGMVPILAEMDVWYSQSNAELSNSQLFHLDWAAQSQVKVFIYASDVEDHSGPLVVISAADSERLRDNVGYRFTQKLKDDTVLKVVEEKDHVPVLGSQGTVALVDTSRCFHYGSRVKTDNASRMVAMFQYLRPSAFNLPLNLKKASPYTYLDHPSLSEIQRLALGID